MTILVTGVSGQVGGALLAAFAGRKDVVAATRAMLDLSRPDDLPAALDTLAPTLILNPAAYTAVDKAEEERDPAFRVNAAAPGMLARWAAARDVPLVHFSTDYVFDGAGDAPFREDDPPRPLSVYGASKLEGETAVRAAGGPSLIVRTSWVYAAQGRNFLATIARLAGERETLRIVADQWGAPTSAAFIADTVAAMLRDGLPAFRQRSAACGGLVHLCAGGVTNWHGFATAIVDGLKQRGVPLKATAVLPIPTTDYPTPAARPKNSRLALDRLRTVFGCETPPWQTLLARELDRMAKA